MAKGKWRIEHVARKPRGGRVITSHSGQHLLRVWYPNPQRRTHGKLLEILHPKRENPFCIFGERCKRNPEELVILGLTSNPNQNTNHTSEAVRAAGLYAKFHGKDPAEILLLQRSAAMRSDYTSLGDLEYLVLLPAGETEAREITFDETDKVKLASNADGTQLYILGGNQDLTGALHQFPVDTTKDLIDLGEIIQVSYIARKKFDGFKTYAYYHDLGEESGVRPRAYYDKIKKEIAVVGGEYKIKAEGIIN